LTISFDERAFGIHFPVPASAFLLLVLFSQRGAGTSLIFEKKKKGKGFGRPEGHAGSSQGEEALPDIHGGGLMAIP
jgi:hypothetical protein